MSEPNDTQHRNIITFFNNGEIDEIIKFLVDNNLILNSDKLNKSRIMLLVDKVLNQIVEHGKILSKLTKKLLVTGLNKYLTGGGNDRSLEVMKVYFGEKIPEFYKKEDKLVKKLKDIKLNKQNNNEYWSPFPIKPNYSGDGNGSSSKRRRAANNNDNNSGNNDNQDQSLLNQRSNQVERSVDSVIDADQDEDEQITETKAMAMIEIVFPEVTDKPSNVNFIMKHYRKGDTYKVFIKALKDARKDYKDLGVLNQVLGIKELPVARIGRKNNNNNNNNNSDSRKDSIKWRNTLNPQKVQETLQELGILCSKLYIERLNNNIPRVQYNNLFSDSRDYLVKNYISKYSRKIGYNQFIALMCCLLTRIPNTMDEWEKDAELLSILKDPFGKWNLLSSLVGNIDKLNEIGDKFKLKNYVS